MSCKYVFVFVFMHPAVDYTHDSSILYNLFWEKFRHKSINQGTSNEKKSGMDGWFARTL